MSPPGFDAAAQAAGAVAFAADPVADRISFQGETGAFGLTGGELGFNDFIDRLGPSDRDRARRAFQGERVDIRLRLIGEGGRVVYARLLGRKTADGLHEGLMSPAGAVSDAASDRIELEQALADGVGEGEVGPWYQPVISLATGRLAGFEALVRWERPGLGVLAPDDFLDLAEDMKLIGAIGDLVRSGAAADLAAWREASGADGVFVAANATVGELVAPGFCDRLLGEIERAGLPPKAYKLEVAETEIMRDPDRAAAVMTELAEAGVALALDDFGTGYSSLARLDMLPFDIVKIDRYFVRAMATGESASTVVRSVLQLAAHYGMQTVAEGVEDAATAEQLAEMGCDFAQGFRYAGAVPPGAAARLLGEGAEGRFSPAGR